MKSQKSSTISEYNKTSCYDFDDQIEVKLYQIFLDIFTNFGATYMSYTFDFMNEKRYSFRTEPLWAKAYNNELYMGRPLIEQCPLDIYSRQKKNIILIWDDFSSKEQPNVFRDIMGMRKDIGLCHGVTLSTYFGMHHDAIAIASENNRDNLAMRIMLNDNRDMLKKYLVSCRKTIINHYSMGEK